jgi:hypothetical protein
MGDLAHSLAADAIERVRHGEPADPRDALALVWTRRASLGADQVIGHHVAAAFPAFDDLIGHFLHLLLDRPGNPGLLEDLALHRRDWVLIRLDPPLGQGPESAMFLDQQHLNLSMRCAAVDDPANGHNLRLRPILMMYRQRWGVEDSFKSTKDCLGWEEVQLLDPAGIRLLVAMAWVAAGFLYQLGITLDDESVQVLARLGGWEPRPKRPPGKITVARGLRRMADLLATDAFLQAYYRDHGPFPVPLTAFLHGWQPRDDLCVDVKS